MISVIIPTYNSSKTILRAIESVLQQTYDDFEVIIIDDGSTDDTKKLINTYVNDSRVFYTFQTNKGPSSARNKGVNLSKANYIAFLDADDEWHKDKLKIQMDTIINKNLNFIGSTYQYEVFDNYINDIKLNKYSFNSLLLKTRFSTPGVLMAKKLFIEIGGFDENLKYAEDNDLWLRIATNYDLYIIELPKLVRLHKSAYGSSGLSSNMYAMFKGELSVLEKLYKNTKITFIKYQVIKFFLLIKFIRRFLILWIQRFKYEN